MVLTGKKLVRHIAVILGLAVFFWFMPLFHVVPLEVTRIEASSGAFDAESFVDEFWDGPLLDSTSASVDVTTLLAAFRQNPSAAADRYGHRLGLGGSTYYLVSGQGRITAIEGGAIRISLANDPGEIVIDTGPVFGNAIRDGSGLLDVSDFANAQDFNAISAEINRKVEAEVFLRLNAQAAIGRNVRFAGGVELPESADAPQSLNLVPVMIEFP